MSAYGPDGRPFDGPRITAADEAFRMAADNRDHYRSDGATPAPSGADEHSWRNAADDEGARYAEAIRGARAMRDTAMNDSHADIAWATEEELECGTPKGWEMGAWPTGAVAPGRFGWTFPE